MSDSDVISSIIPAVLCQILPVSAKHFPVVLVFNILVFIRIKHEQGIEITPFFTKSTTYLIAGI